MSYLGYPDFFEPYIKKVEQTRPARVEKRKKGEEFPFMSLQERQEILKYHPDYKEEGNFQRFLFQRYDKSNPQK
jgi:succinate dehydrogenase / fumarate reductase flavoprotein subunit/L-aspartate oxidase